MEKRDNLMTVLLTIYNKISVVNGEARVSSILNGKQYGYKYKDKLKTILTVTIEGHARARDPGYAIMRMRMASDLGTFAPQNMRMRMTSENPPK